MWGLLVGNTLQCWSGTSHNILISSFKGALVAVSYSNTSGALTAASDGIISDDWQFFDPAHVYPLQADLRGGSLSVDCALCPVKRGAFKRMSDTREWVHLVRRQGTYGNFHRHHPH